MKIIDKLRDKPLKTKKTIFWIVMIIAGIICLSIYFLYLSNTFKNIQKQDIIDELNISELKEGLDGIDSVDLKPAQDMISEISNDLDKFEELKDEIDNNQ